MVVANHKVCHLKDGNEPGGTGIENVRKGLQLLYPSAHNLLILDKEDQYKVELKIHLS